MKFKFGDKVTDGKMRKCLFLNYSTFGNECWILAENQPLPHNYSRKNIKKGWKK